MCFCPSPLDTNLSFSLEDSVLLGLVHLGHAHVRRQALGLLVEARVPEVTMRCVFAVDAV